MLDPLSLFPHPGAKVFATRNDFGRLQWFADFRDENRRGRRVGCFALDAGSPAATGIISVRERRRFSRSADRHAKDPTSDLGVARRNRDPPGFWPRSRAGEWPG